MDAYKDVKQKAKRSNSLSGRLRSSFVMDRNIVQGSSSEPPATQLPNSVPEQAPRLNAMDAVGWEEQSDAVDVQVEVAKHLVVVEVSCVRDEPVSSPTGGTRGVGGPRNELAGGW